MKWFQIITEKGRCLHVGTGIPTVQSNNGRIILTVFSKKEIRANYLERITSSNTLINLLKSCYFNILHNIEDKTVLIIYKKNNVLSYTYKHGKQNYKIRQLHKVKNKKTACECLVYYE